MAKNHVHIIGGGLAGSEAAYFLASNGIKVFLHEMRPTKMTAAHKTGFLGELVCSNSLKSQAPISAPGILKAEMNIIGSLVLNCAKKAAIPGGEALTVDREIFSSLITNAIKSHSNIEVNNHEVAEPIGDSVNLIATGPLTSESLGNWLGHVTSERDLYFYDAIAPIVDADSIDQSQAFLANRYNKGLDPAYLNCPLTENEYDAFIETLLSAEKVKPKVFEEQKYFQGCQPIEAIAEGGKDSLRFGAMKPVGLIDPKTGRRPFAVVQLRPENSSRSAYNLVGFQTKLKYPEQQRVFRLIPALKNAEFLRFGSIHRNTFVCGPKVLNTNLSLKKCNEVFLAGQITGVEGYLESAACGLLAAIFILYKIYDLPVILPPENTGLGALIKYITRSEAKNYQPTNIHFGLFDHSMFENLLSKKKDVVREEISKQAVNNFQKWWLSSPLCRSGRFFDLSP